MKSVNLVQFPTQLYKLGHILILQLHLNAAIQHSYPCGDVTLIEIFFFFSFVHSFKKPSLFLCQKDQPQIKLNNIIWQVVYLKRYSHLSTLNAVRCYFFLQLSSVEFPGCPSPCVFCANVSSGNPVLTQLRVNLLPFSCYKNVPGHELDHRGNTDQFQCFLGNFSVGGLKPLPHTT